MVPAGIVLAGGDVLHFGMPVDPGNLLLLARFDDTPVIGLPGCARSPKLNGFDWVLARLLAGLEVTPKDISGNGPWRPAEGNPDQAAAPRGRERRRLRAPHRRPHPRRAAAPPA